MLLRLNHSLTPTLKTTSLVFLATVAASLVAHAGPEYASSAKDVNKNVIEKPAVPERFYLEIGAAGEFDYHATKFISNGTADFGTVPAVIPVAAAKVHRQAVIGVPGAFSLPATIQSRDFTSTHDLGAIDGQVNFGYIVNPLVSVYGGFVYTHDNGDHSRRLGSVTDVLGSYGVAGGNYDLYGDVGQYQSFAGLAGAKITLPRTILDFIHAPKFISPYFNLAAGAKYIQAQHIRFYSGSVDAVDTTIKLYDPSLVFTAKGGFGYELKIARNFSINVDTDYGYDTKPQRPDNSSGFTGIDKSGDRFYETVGLSAVFKF